MEQTLDRDATLMDGAPLPPLWHWLYHIESVPISRIGPDGHPRRGGFLPPVALPRRMWAGGGVEFVAPIALGEEVDKKSTVETIDLKSGASGQLCFVTVRHELSVDDEPRIVETQNLAYREDPARNKPTAPAQTKASPGGAEWTRQITPNEVMLFRYSALTFNGHRIHYDRDYCRDVEGYPGLVFQGPLTATLLADLLCDASGQPLSSFKYRAISPLFDTARFSISAKSNKDGLEAWAETSNRGLAMTATATLAG
jgi:3-methylfumaryl-CoA hydratase